MSLTVENEATAVRRWSDPARYLGFTAPYNADVSWGKVTALYLIRHGDLIKIGIANNLERRLRELRAGNPEGLEVVAYRSVPRPLARQVERRMHEHFAHLAIGREWFRGLDVRDALRVAANHVRRAKVAIARWEADGFWGDTPWPPARDTVAALDHRLAAARIDLADALAALVAPKTETTPERST